MHEQNRENFKKKMKNGSCKITKKMMKEAKFKDK